MDLKIKIIFAFILIARLGFSQSFCDNGAIWHYNYAVWQTKDIIEIKYIKDTIIGTTTCNVLQKKRDYYNLATETFHTTYLGNEYVYENNSVVYRYNFAQFDTLFNFNANVGDSWKITGSSKFGVACDSTGYLKVDSIGTTIINSITLKYICVSPKTGSNWGMTAKVVEKIGPIKNFNFNYVSYLFPIKTDNCGVLVVDAYEEGGYFRCYSDNNFQYNLLDAQTPSCDYIINIKELDKNKSKINAFPNPANTEVSFTLEDLNLSKNITIEIADISGKLYLTEKLQKNNNQATINISNLSNGLYLITLKNENGIIKVQKLSVQN